MPISSPLHQFEGRDVIGTTVVLTNTGDGLSKAVNVDAIEIQHGQHVYLVVEAEADKVRFDRSKDDPSKLLRVQILKGGTVSIVEYELVKGVLEDQERKNDLAQAKAKIPFNKDVDRPEDWESAERLPGGPVAIADLAESELLKKRGGRRKPKIEAET